MGIDALRFLIFIGAFVVLAYAEERFPRRSRRVNKVKRWFINLSLTFVNGFLVKLILGAAAVGVAFYAKENGWGLLNFSDAPVWLAFIVTFLFLDLMIYIQHVAAHALPVLWRFHMVHHSDIDFDVSTALRFHPVEILLSMLYKIGLVAAIGADPWAVIVFEAVLNASAQFNHSNLKLPEELEASLRRFIITPDVHRIHHSVEVEETNSNFGFFLSWWDKLCGTFRDEPGMPQGSMPIGLKEYRVPDDLTLPDLIMMPVHPQMGRYSMKS